VKSTARFIPFFVVLSLLTSLFLITPISAAGAVALDKTFVTTPGGVVKITVTDSSLDAGVSQADVAAGVNAAGTATAFTIGNFNAAEDLAAGSTVTVFTSKVPLLDGPDADSNFNRFDVTVTTTSGTLTVYAAGASEGSVTLQNTGVAAIAAAATFTLTYTAADVQTIQVTVESTQETDAINVTLLETGASTGVFEATFGTATSTAASKNILSGSIAEADIGVDLNSDGDITDSVTVTSTATVSEVTIGVDLNNDGDATDTAVAAIDVGALPGSPTRPGIGVILAGDVITVKHGSVQSTVTVEVTDPTVTITSPADADSTQIQTTRLVAEVSDIDAGIDSATIVFSITAATDRLNGGADLCPCNGLPLADTGEIGVQAIGTPTLISNGYLAEAQLVNVDEGETDITYSVTVTDKAGNVGTSSRTLKVDTQSPSFLTSRTNADATVATNAAAETGHFWDSAAATPAIEELSTKTLNTSIALYFNEDLDGSSISKADFEVDIGGAKSTPAAAEWFSGAASVVFLTVPAMASDTKPKVDVVGAIKDTAGNPVASIVMGANADDGVAPTVTVTVSPSSLLSTKEVTITVSSNEKLLTTPTITLNGGTTDLSAITSLGSNSYSATLTTVTADKYDLAVTGTDSAGNSVTVDGGDIEIDNALPHPTTEPISNADTGATVATTYSGSPLFLEIDWTAEGSEYGATDDTHDAVTLTAVTLDGTDVSGSVSEESVGSFIVALGELAVGAYSVAFSGADEVGNTRSETIAFTVAKRPDFTVPLSTGWNLISFPGTPADTAIATVIDGTSGTNHPIDVVMTYAPTGQGGWLINTRGDDGLWATEGPNILTTLDGTSAYWVRTDSFEDLSVTIPGVRGGTATLLPVLSLSKGWNLLPVLDVSGAPATATTTAAAYLDGLSVSRIYEYNTRGDQFDSVNTATGALAYGRGYWVYLTAAGVLVP